MFGSPILEVAIAIALIYLLLSLVVSTANETIAAVLQSRGRTLRAGIQKLLADRHFDGLARQLFSHPLVAALSPGNPPALPSYLSARTFAVALLDLINASPGTTLVERIEALPIGSAATREELAQALGALMRAREPASWDEIRKVVEDWFNDAMDRVSGWYKRRVQFITVILALALSGGLGIDTFFVAETLLRDSNLRAAVVERATAVAAAPKLDLAAQDTGLASAVERLQTLQVPLGWHQVLATQAQWHPGDTSPWIWVKRIVGILVTALAISLGAPFWFDILSRAVRVRAAGPRPAGEEARGTK